MRHEIDVNEFSDIVREFAGYKRVIQGCSIKTVEEYLMDLRTFFRYLLARDDEAVLSDPDAFAKIQVDRVDLDMISKITSQDIYSFLLFTDKERGNQTAAKARKLSAIKSLFAFLIKKRNCLSIDPTVNIESPKKKQALPKYLNESEAIQLLNTVASVEDEKTRARDYAIITLFLNCGMRVSELVGISLSDISPDLTSLRVLGKGNKERTVFLNPACQTALKDHFRFRLAPDSIKSGEKALFLSNRQARISVKTVQALVYKYLKLAGLENKKLSVHKLRHTAATLMYQSGEVDIRVLKEILGHEQLTTTQIYTHLTNRDVQQAMQKHPLANVTAGNHTDSPNRDDKPDANPDNTDEDN